MPRTAGGESRTKVFGVRVSPRTWDQFRQVCKARQENVNPTIVGLMEGFIARHQDLLAEPAQTPEAALHTVAAEHGMTVEQLQELLDAHRPDTP